MRYAQCQICNSEVVPVESHEGVCINCGYNSWYDFFDYPRKLWVNIKEAIRKSEDNLHQLQKDIKATREGNKVLNDQLKDVKIQLEVKEKLYAKLLGVKQKIQEQLSELERQEQETIWQFNEMKSEIRLNDFLVSPVFESVKRQISLHWGYLPQGDSLMMHYEVRKPNILDDIDLRDVLLILLREGKKTPKIVNAEAGEYFINLKHHLKNGRNGKNFSCRLQPVLQKYGLRPGKYKIALSFDHIKYSPDIYWLENDAFANQDIIYFPTIVLR